MQKNITFFIVPFFIFCMWTQPVNCMSQLEILPNELFEEVLKNLTKKDIKTIRQTSRAFYEKSQRRWNRVRLSITFPDSYGLKQVAPNLFKYAPKKKQRKNNSDNFEPLYVTDINDLPVCPIPGCRNKPEPRSDVMEIKYGYGLLYHLHRANSTSYSWQQHCQLADFIRVLLADHPIQKADASIAAHAITQINTDDYKNPRLLALTQSIIENKQLTGAQRGRIITHFEDTLEFLANNEKMEGKANRKEKNKAERGNRPLSLQAAHDDTKLAALVAPNCLIRLSEARLTQTQAAASPLRTLHFNGLNTYQIPRRQIPAYSPRPTVRLALPADLSQLTLHDEADAPDENYLESDRVDREELIEVSDIDKEKFVNDVLSTLITDDVAQSMPSMPEPAPLPDRKDEPQSHQGKRPADFAQDEPSPKRKRVTDLQTPS